MDFLEIFTEYGGFVALPVVINAIMLGLKKGFKQFFIHPWGIRLLYFLPLVLGACGGLLLSLDSIQEKILVGSALGAVSHYVYKFVTVTLASKTKISKLQAAKVLKDGVEEPVEESEDDVD